jgi:steroid 5-alpha reductase family enzyme
VLPVLLASLATVTVLMLVTALASHRAHRYVYVDFTWGSGFVLVAAVSAVLGSAPIRWLLLVMVAIWGGRLAWHVGRRIVATDDDDPRYVKLMEGKPFSFALTRIFLTQGVAMWFVSLPVQVAAAGDQDSWTWLVVLGVVVWLVGLAFESIGDAQLSAYRSQPKESRPTVMDRGLWRYTRHPNYFGDACVWWGIFLVAVGASRTGLFTVLSPVVMTYFLIFATGAKLLEKTMMKRPGYPEYAERTSMFFPLLPKRAPRD